MGNPRPGASRTPPNCQVRASHARPERFRTFNATEQTQRSDINATDCSNREANNNALHQLSVHRAELIPETGDVRFPRQHKRVHSTTIVMAELKRPRRVGTAPRKPAGCGTHHEPNQQTYEQKRRNELSLHRYRAHTEYLDTCPNATHESSYVRNKGLLQPHNVKMSAMRRFRNFPCLRGRVEVEYCNSPTSRGTRTAKSRTQWARACGYQQEELTMT
jgi:hypothetical protein